MGELTRCRTCNYPLTAPREIERGACLPHGIDNTLGRLAEQEDAPASTSGAREGVQVRSLGRPPFLPSTLLADEGMAVVTKPEPTCLCGEFVGEFDLTPQCPAHPPTCTLCGMPALGWATDNDKRLCHGQERDCYRRWTVYGGAGPIAPVGLELQREGMAVVTRGEP